MQAKEREIINQACINIAAGVAKNPFLSLGEKEKRFIGKERECLGKEKERTGWPFGKRKNAGNPLLTGKLLP